MPQLVRIMPAPEVKQTRKRGELMVATTCPSGGALDIFIEPQLPRPLLVVFGDSPAARAIVQMASVAGFRSCAVHPGARAQDFPVPIWCCRPSDVAEANPGADSWAVVATHGPLRRGRGGGSVTHPHLQVALVASTRRAAAVRDALRARGLGEDVLGRLHTPAGRVRGASQEEIAVLALAEVVTARRRRGPVHQPAAAPAVLFATDPVCGMTVDPLTSQHKAVHDGTTFWFCCDGCRTEFEKEPARYLRPIEA